MTSGALVLGLLNGLTIGLLAAGLVLVYKSNRFLNLAHAQMGTLSALLLAKFVLDWSWPWWAAFAVAVAIGTATGLLVERAFVRPLRAKTASTVSLLLLSVGVSQLLLALTFIPRLGPNPNRLASRLYPRPFEAHVRVGGVVLGGHDVMTVVLVPILVGALALFLQRTSLGKMIRASASNADAARLCGIDTDRVSAVTWAIAGAFAAVSAVLQAPSQPSFNIAALGPSLLLLTLGAAAFGAFVSLPLALMGGLVLGVVQQVASSRTSNAGVGQLSVLVVILAVLFVRGRAIERAFHAGRSLIEDRAPLRPSPDAPWFVRRQRLVGVLVFATIAVVLPALPYFRTEAHRFELSLVLVYALIAVSLTMLVGWSGQVSLGHFSIVGIGAFIAARAVPHDWTVVGMAIAAGITGAAVMVVVGLPALRVRGLTLAVTTLGLGVVAPEWLFRQSWFGSERPFGIDLSPPRLPAGLGRVDGQLASYYVALSFLLLAILAGSALRRSVPGRVIIGVRDNEKAVSAFGFTPATVKLAALATSGFFAGISGVLWAVAWRRVSPLDFPADLSLPILALPVIGGLGSIPGAVASAITVYAPAYFLSPIVRPLFGRVGANVGFQLALAGAGTVLTLLAYPAGLAGAGQRWWERLTRPSSEARASAVVTAMAPPPPRRRAHEPGAVPLAVEDVAVRFGGIRAVDSVSLQVDEHEIVGLIGPNGAGKTTLMNVISGVLTPAAGTLRLFGRDVSGMSADTRAVFGLGRTFQQADLFPGLTVLETIQLALSRTRRIGIPAAALAAPWAREAERDLERDAEAILHRFGLTPWRDSLTLGLSTGTRRICDLAAQFAAAPEVLLLDEPTAGVAQREAEAFGPLLRRIREEVGCSILLVEHDMPLLMGLCDRIYAMDSGRIIAEGTPEQVRQDPLVVASYLGTDETAIGRSGSSRTGLAPAISIAAIDTTQETS